jgi:hypothetical protein
VLHYVFTTFQESGRRQGEKGEEKGVIAGMRFILLASVCAACRQIKIAQAADRLIFAFRSP